MKRKRKHKSAEAANKRSKSEGTSQHSLVPLLRQYYPTVSTLREYLISRTSRASKKRRRVIDRYGRGACPEGQRRDGSKLTRLLDDTLIGSFDLVNPQSEDSHTKDLIVFTQQLPESTLGTNLTQTLPGQSEIVDFAIWLLFRRYVGNHKPSHILCLSCQRNTIVSDGTDVVALANVPGVMANGTNAYAQTLKEEPWASLPIFLGKGAERVLSEMLVSCGIFTPMDDSSNLMQICGTPLSDLKPLAKPVQLPVSVDHVANDHSSKATLNGSRGLSDVRFVRHRMLYARPPLSSSGHIRYGLDDSHVLSRLLVHTSAAQTCHILKYVFPKQFGLHNVFTSGTEPTETTQALRDYTFREDEIARIELAIKRRRPIKRGLDAGSSTGNTTHLPKRLRGEVFKLIARLRKRQSACAYHALLQHYCPGHERTDNRTTGGVRLANSPSQVSAFCRAVITSVFPNELWGTGQAGIRNRHVIMLNIHRFIELRRYESLSLHGVMQQVEVSAIQWLRTPKTEGHARISRTDFDKRKELMGELLYYLIDSFVVPLIRSFFHVTESNVHRNQLLFFRHDVWKAMSDLALNSLKVTMFERLSSDTVKAVMPSRRLGVSRVRLLPKDIGMRPIINLRRRVQTVQRGKAVLGKSVNSFLTPSFSVLKYVKEQDPFVLGSALFSVDDIFPRLQRFQQKLDQKGLSATPLYFAKVDVRACFDTIPQKRLMRLIRTILKHDRYSIARYARSKLVSGQNREMLSNGAKSSWKYIARAISAHEVFDFKAEAGLDSANGRTRTVYVDGVVQRQESRQSVLSLLEEHVESNFVQIGRQYYRQKEGIPQGSVVSSILCSFLYAELERDALAFLNDGQTLLLRLIDDFLVISVNKATAERFIRTMHAGVPEFGVEVKPEKSRVNFDIVVSNASIARLAAVSDFPYCGHAINTVTMDLSKDRDRRRKSNLADSMTVEYSKLPGQTFYRKILSAMKLQIHAMLFSTKFNALETVLENVYHAFTEVALKAYHYVRSLPLAKQPQDKLVVRTFDDAIKLGFALMKRRKPKSEDVLPYECAVSNAQARWLACTALCEVFRRRQTRFRNVLAWLHGQLDMVALRRSKGMLSGIVQKYNGVTSE